MQIEPALAPVFLFLSERFLRRARMLLEVAHDGLLEFVSAGAGGT